MGVEDALKLEAAVKAALRGHADLPVLLSTAEPDEPLTEPDIICNQVWDHYLFRIYICLIFINKKV